MGFASSRLPSTITIGQGGHPNTVKLPQSPVPLRKQVFHESAFKTMQDVARQLNTMQTELHDATLPARTNSRNQAITFEGVVFDLPLFPLNKSLQHNLGTKVRWAIVRWYDTTSLPSIVEPVDSQKDPNVLVVQALVNVAGTADIEVWSAT